MAVADGDAVLLEVEVDVAQEVAVAVLAAVKVAREVAVAVLVAEAVKLAVLCSLRFMRIAEASSVAKTEKSASKNCTGMRAPASASVTSCAPRSRKKPHPNTNLVDVTQCDTFASHQGDGTHNTSINALRWP